MSKDSPELAQSTNPLTAISQIYSSLSIREQAISGLPLVLMLAVFWNLDKFGQEQRLLAAILSGALVTVAWIFVLAKNLLAVKDEGKELKATKNELLFVFRDRLKQFSKIKRQVKQISIELEAYDTPPQIKQSFNSLLVNLDNAIQESQSRVLEITDSSKTVKTDKEYAEEAQRLKEWTAQKNAYKRK